MNAAVAAAKQAYESWKLFPAPKRGEILYKAGQILIERKEQLAREMTREMGKVLAEARGDVQEVIDMTFYAAGEGRRL
ncbi:aldehyde dehydrogenase family protein, partial [Acinetobacter baumannii]